MTAEEIRAERIRLSNELIEARTDVAMLERLNAAKSRAASLQAQLAKLDKALVQAMNDEGKAEREARLSRIRNLRILVRGSDLLNSGSFEILWEAPAYNYQRHETEWLHQSRIGFAAVPEDVMTYILEDKPDTLPALIANLAPGDPYQAMSRYMRSLTTNYLVAA